MAKRKRKCKYKEHHLPLPDLEELERYADEMYEAATTGNRLSTWCYGLRIRMGVYDSWRQADSR